MEKLSVNRWTKGDKDRVYVARYVNGVKEPLGYVDVKTGYTINETDEFPPSEVYKAAANYAVANMIGLPAMRAAERRETIQHADDLSSNKAGTAVEKNKEGFNFRKMFSKETDSWAVGAKGEKEVGKIFDKAKDVKVIHSLVVNSYGADIDHVLYTPYGIYTVNTKTHRGAKVTANGKGGLYVNGNKVDYIKKAKKEAETVSQALSRAAGTLIPITPVICFHEPGIFNAAAEPGVMICSSANILDSIRIRRTSMTKDQILWLYEQSKLPETWKH